MAEVRRDAGLSALIGSSTIEMLADGFEFTEGPLWQPDGFVLFQDIKAEATYRWSPEGRVDRLRAANGAANGQTFLPDGRIIFCEQIGRRISRMTADGQSVETIAEHWDGKRLNSPNDIVVRSDGLVVFTDPPYGVPPDRKEIPFQAVMALDPDGSSPWVLADDFEKPNGLAFSPDESILYVCDTAHYHVRAFDVSADGRLSRGRIFATQDPTTPGGPDGMKVDHDGRVYVAVAEGIWVYSPDGTLLGILAMPKRPSNLNWGGPDGRELYITAVDALHRIVLPVSGILPCFTPQDLDGIPLPRVLDHP